ncbi:MAG: UvrD-helicase domain-containing protein [Oscillospiraceae bacterium]
MSGKMTWTDEQLTAINYPSDSSACVTAAAGSGKTALLIERVVTLIRGKPEEGVPAVPGDKFAILTFTRNAAEEFRTRMTLAIDRASRSSGADFVPREQLIKFRSSVISTINSFCLGVLKEHAELFGLPVSFSIVEESKGLIMRQTALDNAMEYFYSPEFAEDFPAVYEGFGGAVSDYERDTVGSEARELLHKDFSFSKDDQLRQAVTSIYLKSTSLADSEEWLDGCASVFSSTEQMERRFLPVIVADLRRQCALLKSALIRYKSLCDSADPDFFDRFWSVYEVDETAVNTLMDSFDRAFPEDRQPSLTDFDRFNVECPGLAFGAFSRSGIPRNNPAYKELKAAVDSVRKRIQKYCADIRDGCGYGSELPQHEFVPQHKAVTALVMLVRRLQAEYSALKRKAGVVDFADCERMLLDKLRDKDCGLRQELSDRYQCIILDEFQDTNDLQYEIFRLISREQKNLFFVGDIKQSIYAFRGGNPEIMARCCAAGSGYEKLPLNRNFRSRGEVITTVNAMFEGVMTEKYGEVDYSDGNGLVQGADFPETGGDYRSELYLMDFPAREKQYPEDTTEAPAEEETSGNKQTDQLELEASNPVAEARFTAALIQKMASERFPVKQADGSARPCSWGDFAILLRSKTHFADYKAELEKLGIPVATNGGNYLSADEINLILAYLKVIDNPQLDEELLTVLMSPLYGMTAEELSLARLGILGFDIEELDETGVDLKPLYDIFSGHSLFSCICAAAGSSLAQQDYSSGAGEVLKLLAEKGIERSADVKCRLFSEHFSEFRRFAANNSVERLIRRIYDDTDFFSVISTYERGDRKLANIRLLLKYTADFESGGGGTLSDFLRYTDAVRQSSGGMEEAVVPQEAADAVQILTFHASKGLQWKIVVLGGLGTVLHEDRASIIIDRKTGIGLKNTLIKERIRTTTLSYNGAKASVETAQLGDELRLLYVAMTRAEEKLIMIGQITEKSAGECCTDSFTPEFALSGNTHLKWVLSSLLRYRDDTSYNELPATLEVPGVKLKWVLNRLPEPEEISPELPENSEPDEESAQRISGLLSEEYPNLYETTLQSRFSVTELAHRDEVREKRPGDIQLKKPEFMTPKKLNEVRMNGILIGNTYHHIMELFPLEALRYDYSPEDMEAAVEVEIDQLIEGQRLTPEECLCAASEKHGDFVRKISSFFCSRLGRDMLSAQRVEREYEVFAEIPAEELFPEENSGSSTTIIQGRVDMLFVKDGRVVVVDYKSDIKGGLEAEFSSYSTQLRLYRRILPLLMTECDGENIDMVLYSFGQERAYYIDSKQQ